MASKKQVLFNDEECVTLVLPKIGECKAGYLYWPCFCIKILVMWDSSLHTMIRIADRLVPDQIELDDSGAYACMYDLEDDDTVAAKDYVSVHDKQFSHIIMLSKRPRSDEDGVRSTVAHEAMHITFSVFRNRGMKLSTDSEEAYTYQTESIVYRVALLRKQKPKRKITL